MKVRADLIAKALAERHKSQGDFFITQCKCGPTTTAARGELFILDAIAVKKSWTRPCITIYEIKVDRGDFLSDEKWPRYKQFCHRFYFACPSNLISPDDLSKGCGLVSFNPENGALRTVKKAAMNDVPLPTDIFYYIIMNRLESERHPFFSQTRDYFEALINDKEERRLFGLKVRSKLLSQVRSLETDLKKFERYEQSLLELEKIREIVSRAGYGGWNLVDNIEKMTAGGGLPPRAAYCITRLEQEVNILKEIWRDNPAPAEEK